MLTSINDPVAAGVINDIVKEEYIHVGQLEKLMQTLNGVANAIEEGSQEAANDQGLGVATIGVPAGVVPEVPATPEVQVTTAPAPVAEPAPVPVEQAAPAPQPVTPSVEEQAQAIQPELNQVDQQVEDQLPPDDIPVINTDSEGNQHQAS